MNYTILEPPIYHQGQYWHDAIALDPEDAAPLLELGLIQESEEPEVEDGDPTLNLVNINTSTLEELVSLDHIGDITGLKIIDNRPYETLEQARLASGLSREKWGKIELHITL